MEHLHSSQIDVLDKFLKRPKDQEETENLNSPITNKKMELEHKSPVSDCFVIEFYQTFKDINFTNSSKKLKEHFPNHSVRPVLSL